MPLRPMTRITEQDIIHIAFTRWPNAAEVHVQFHTHIVSNRFGQTVEGLCRCAVEGVNVRKQFTAKNAIDLANKVMQNRADEGFELDLDGSQSLISAAELLWDSEMGRMPNEDQDDHRSRDS